MNDREWLGKRFEEDRAHVRAVAYRMLGSLSEADDAVQQTWIRLSRTDTSGIENLTGWLTTVARAGASTCCAPATRGGRSRSVCTCPIRS